MIAKIFTNKILIILCAIAWLVVPFLVWKHLGAVWMTPSSNGDAATWTQAVADWTQVGLSLLMLCSVFAIYWQVRADHDRSRREQAIELLRFWAIEMNSNAPAVYHARTLISKLHDPEIEAIWKLQSLGIPSEHRAELAGALGIEVDALPAVKTGKIPVNSAMASKIRDRIGFYLNMLEVLATAWRHHVADRAIIEQEFVMQMTPESGRFPLEAVLKVCPFFPSLRVFRDHLVNSNTPTIKTKKAED